MHKCRSLTTLLSSSILEHRRSLCSDGSDLAHCLHKIYTGCFLYSDDLGLSIAHCDKCFCRLKHNSSNVEKNFLYKSIGTSHRGSHVVGDVCLGVDSPKMCDGVPDCVNGADEGADVCGISKGAHNSREAKSIEQNFSEGNSHLPLLSALILVCVVIYVTSVVAVCTWCRVGKVEARDEAELLGGGGSAANSTVDSCDNRDSLDNVYVSVTTVSPNWSWNCARLVRELGNGCYGKVYLAEEVCGRLVAVKTRNQKVADDDFVGGVYENEIEVLLGISGKHDNVIQLLSYNTDSQILVFEYCHNGSLKKYVGEHKGRFVDELDTVHREIVAPTGINCCTISRVNSFQSLNTLPPMSEYLTSLHNKLDIDFVSYRSGAVGSKFNTTRFVKWARQIACGMEFLAGKNVVHGDLALRNILLTQTDVVKISDFGLARKEQNCWIRKNKSFPVAWMSPECLRDGYSSKSGDVWSYGVALWELFSLGDVPYKSEDAYVHLDGLGSWLESGNRLNAPAFMPKTLEVLMSGCWESRQEIRPTFRTIAESLRPVVGRRMVSATLPRHFRGGTVDSGISLSPTLASAGGSNYLPMDRLTRCEEERSNAGGESVSYWNGYKIMGGTNSS
jgi:serine/threonine protein kinase